MIYQFGYGISKMVGPKKEDFWPRMNKLKEEKEISSMNDGLPKIAIIVKPNYF